MTADLIVLGAGPAGLGAAYRASKDGRKVVVLEKADRVGGAAGSFEVGGQRVDVGSHRLHPSVDPAILDELRTLLGADLQLRSRHGRMRIGDRWVHFPLKASDALRNLPRSLAAGMLRDAIVAPARKPKKDTYEEVLRASLGPTLCERFYFPYARKMWGLEPHEIAGEQARKRVSAGSLLDVAKRTMMGSKSGGRSGAGHFLYPKRGYGQISEALADAAAKEGTDLRIGSAVTRVGLGRTSVTVELERGDAVEGSVLFSSLPVPALARFAHPQPPEEVMEAASQLSFRSMVLVYLVVPRPRYTEFDAHYFPEEWTPVTRVSEPKNYRSGDDPADRTVLCVEIPCTRGDRAWTMTDAELSEVAVDALTGAGLPDPEPAETVIHKLPFAYPVYDLDYKERFDAIDAWAENQPRLISFGRLGLFVHDNAHHALAMAWAAAACLGEDGEFDHAAWARARQDFAKHVVED